MRNYFILNGVDSRDFGVYISGQGTFSAPRREYDMIQIPGRNGDLVGNEKRFENLELTYRAFIYANFKENIRNFRNFLLSQVGYQKLTDSYHPDEFRMALYEGEFEPDVTPKNDAGEFEIVFNCKPQRYLNSGEEVITFDGETNTYSGEIATFEGKPGDSISKITANIDPVQEGSGDPSPDNVRPISGHTGMTISHSGADMSNPETLPISWQSEAGTVYGGNLDVTTGVLTVDRAIVSYSDSAGFANHSSGRWYYNGLPSGADYSKRTSATSNQATYSDSTLTYKPYFAFGSAGVYINKLSADETIEQFSARLQANPFQICYFLATPQTYTLTAEQMTTLLGTNNIWTDVGDTAVEVYSTAIEIENPTRFASQPLLRVYGAGQLGINSDTITISRADEYTDIDCAMMDCFKGTTNRNQFVSFSGYNFPTLQAGENNVSLGSGISRVEITPRWWRL